MYAVITGDIINFTKLNAIKRKFLIENSEKLLKGWIRESADAEVYRGDSYQALFDDIYEALKRSIQLICWFKTQSDQRNRVFLSSRISIGIGEVAYRGKNVLSSDGEAFHLSGRNFDKMKPGELLSILTNDEFKNEIIQIILTFANKIIDQWTLPQAEVILLLLEDKTQQEIADRLKVSQPSVNSRIKLSAWRDIESAIKFISDLAYKK